MGIWGFLLVLLFSPLQPQPGDWVCIADPTDKSNTCSVFAYDADKEEAKRKAIETCQDDNGCGAELCVIISCRKAVKD